MWSRISKSSSENDSVTVGANINYNYSGTEMLALYQRVSKLEYTW